MENTKSRRFGMLLSGVAVLALAAVVTAGLSAPATASVDTKPVAAKAAAAKPVAANAADGGSAGHFRIGSVTGLAPGELYSSHWNNTPTAPAYFVDVFPIPTTVTQPCQIEIVKSSRLRRWNANNTYELEIYWTIKNVGQYECNADVYLGWTNN